MRAAQHIRVEGIVQGVGFRPFVWRLARELQLSGWVRNDSRGVEIAVEGGPAQVQALVERLRREAPPRARVDALQAQAVALRGLQGFHIAESHRERCATAIGPDAAVCEECLREMFDPGGRRWRHAFITCTHCGPRYTIADSLPYDRAHTSMRDFALCGDCAREYADPADRRFHAEPTACPHCGPRLSLCDAGGGTLDGDPITLALQRLRSGDIVAIKGLGGYHLACNALDPRAVASLRERKHREAKPFALMVADVAAARDWVRLTPEAAALLQSAERSIVLASRLSPDEALPGVAPGLGELGVMLPSTPLQWLLFHEAAGRPAGVDWIPRARDLVLVMTSANPGGEPLLTDDAQTLQRLHGIADVHLRHDRPIAVRCDDSVVQGSSPPCVVRRARGHTPLAIRWRETGPAVLAVGAHLKSTLCVTRGAEGFLSQHLGDLDNAPTLAYFEETLAHLLGILEIEPQLIAHDLHPDMPSTRLAADVARARGLPLLGVQHHHAHVAAIAAEHHWHAPLLGIALDGIGYGDDGGAWGGELLSVDGARMRRVGHLRTLALPGGDQAAREPWRMAAAALHALGRGAEIAARFAAQRTAPQLQMLLDRGVRCPPTSSMGRVFDAAASLLGVAQHSRFEGEAAMRLESCARRGGAASAGAAWDVDGEGRLDLLPLLAALADWRGDAAQGAAMFHQTLADAVAAWAVAAAERERHTAVALAGGCFLNTLLREGVATRLRERGLRVLQPVAVPPNDGAISLGQAWVARAWWKEKR